MPWRRRAKARAQRAAQREVIRYRHTRGYFEVSGAPEIVEVFVAQGPAQCPPIVNIGLQIHVERDIAAIEHAGGAGRKTGKAIHGFTKTLSRQIAGIATLRIPKPHFILFFAPFETKGDIEIRG